jgi:RimJ/RimL family protein N-acetyltransferase
MVRRIQHNGLGASNLRTTTDKAEIKDILKDYYESVTYDGCPAFEDFEPDTENSLWFVLEQEEEVAGIIKLENMNLTTWIPHIVIFEQFRGNGSEHWGKQVIQYMKERIKDVNFLVLTPYESARNYAERVGFKFIGVLPDSIKRNGKLMNQYVLGGCP